MAFVSEEIKEEDKEYFNSIGFTQLAHKNRKVTPFWWVIDREREIVMTGRGGVFAEPTRGFAIYVNKQIVNMELMERGSGDYFKKDVKIHYIIQKVEIPKKLLEDGTTVEEIKELIMEVFMAAGSYGHDREKTMETKITMETEPIVV